LLRGLLGRERRCRGQHGGEEHDDPCGHAPSGAGSGPSRRRRQRWFAPGRSSHRRTRVGRPRDSGSPGCRVVSGSAPHPGT
jgi:hypothetical protein